LGETTPILSAPHFLHFIVTRIPFLPFSSDFSSFQSCEARKISKSSEFLMFFGRVFEQTLRETVSMSCPNGAGVRIKRVGSVFGIRDTDRPLHRQKKGVG
jgi:hypothetical protein